MADLLVIPRFVARSLIFSLVFKKSTDKLLNPLATSTVIPFDTFFRFLNNAINPVIFFDSESYPISLYNSYKIYFTTNKIYAIIDKK